jgi:signal transduction histidine kinase/ActR/RegA family two-component response regulator
MKEKLQQMSVALQAFKAFVSKPFGCAQPRLAVGPEVAERAGEIYRRQLFETAQRVDWMFALLMVCQYVVCVIIAFWSAEPAWPSSPGLTHIHFWTASLFGAVFTAAPVACAVLQPGSVFSRHVVAVGQMLMSALLIAVTGGRIETHFHIFGSLAFLAFYRDWRVLATASITVAVDQCARGVLWPESVFGVGSPDYWRWLEHTGWVVFEDVFLTLSILQSLWTLRDACARQAELENARDSAERASRAKDDFIATLSHELRTPLTPSLMTLSALGSDETLSPELREELAMVRRNVELEARLIDDLLDLTRIAQGKIQLLPGAVDVHAALNHVLENCRGEFAAKELALEVGLEAPRPWVSGDAARLQQVFWNLLKNAIKFTEKGGAVVVRTTNEGNRLKIDFADNGIGISADVLPKIFHRFEQGGVAVTRQFGGLGLGLSISRAIVELHHGAIRAESRGEGWGSTFTVVLTAMATAPSSRRSNETQLLRRTGKLPRRILLVDDHADTRETLVRLLTRAGYEVTPADSMTAALQCAQEAKFDLLVSDIGLPDGTGYELMMALQEHFGLPGIAFSGYGMEHDVKKSIEAGFSAHLTKPIDFDRLKEAMSKALSEPRSPAARVRKAAAAV